MNAPAWVVVILAAGAFIVTAVPGAGLSDAEREPTVESITYEGESVVVAADEPLHLWRSDGHEFTVRVASDERVEEASVCLVAEGSDWTRGFACRNGTLAAGETWTVSLTVSEWPAETNGRVSLAAVVRDRTNATRIAERSRTVVVLSRDGDRDEDGLTNERELGLGTDIDNPDTDGDGLDDGVEVTVHHTDPTVADTDGDGLPDGREVEIGTTPTRADTDGDGLDDGAEIDMYQTNATQVDSDGDGLADGEEVTRYDTDPTVVDTDGDRLDDGAEINLHDTDPVRVDTDGDGLSDAEEVRDYGTDPTSADTDGDRLDDGAELADYGTDPLASDTDGDGLADGAEVDFGSDPTDATSTADPGLVERTGRTVGGNALAVGLGLAVLTGVILGALARRLGFRLVPGRLAEQFTWGVSGTSRASEEERAASAESDEVTASDPVDDESAPAGAVSSGAWSEADDGTSSEPSEPSPDMSVITNEERVAYLLAENDGRMLQSEMVEAGDWSKATVSRVLSRMEEADAVTRVDVGKGNLVTRPEDEPPSTESPFSN
jgi:hypothetical protein